MSRRWRWCTGLAVAGLIGAAIWSMRAPIYHPPDDIISIPTGPDAIARGKHLVEAVAVCTICHGENLGGNSPSMTRSSATATLRI